MPAFEGSKSTHIINFHSTCSTRRRCCVSAKWELAASAWAGWSSSPRSPPSPSRSDPRRCPSHSLLFSLRSLRTGSRICWLNHSHHTQSLALTGGDGPARVHIQFVTYQHAYHFLVDVLAHLLVPHVDIVEGLPVGEVIDNEDAISSAVVTVGDGAETFLPSGVPLHNLTTSTSTTLTLSFLLSTYLTFYIGGQDTKSTPIVLSMFCVNLFSYMNEPVLRTA